VEVSSPLNVHLEQYEGPLDLLLDLIRKQEINIYDIPIATITRQYLDYIEQAMALDIELSAEFVERLLEYERFKSAAAMLQEKRMVEEAIWSNPQMQSFVSETEGPGLAVTLFDLVKTFEQVLERAKHRPLYEVNKEDVSVPDMIRFLKRTLEDLPRGQAVELVPLFERQRSIRAMICLFLAVLEMVKQQAIRLTQSESFGAIEVRRDKGFDELQVNEEVALRIEEDYKA
jgi:segregation and condensation protein A